MLHTPVFYAVMEMEGAARALASNEARFGVGNVLGEINFFKVRVDGEMFVADVYAVKKIPPDKRAIVRRCETSHGKAYNSFILD